MARDGFDPAILDEPEAMVATNEMVDGNSAATSEDDGSVGFSD